MPINYEPSPADSLAPALDTFSKGLQKLLQPNHDFQIAMQKAVGGNPELAQQLADLEYNAPGSLDRMGFGNLGKVLAQIPESEKSQFIRTSRGDILKGDQLALEGRNAQSGFDLGRLNDTINFLKDPKNAAIKSDEILRRLTGQTQGERDLTAARALSETTDANVKAAEAPGAIAKAKVAKKAYEDALAANPALQNTDFLGLARDFNAGKPGASQAVSAAFATPGAAEAMSHAMSVVNTEAVEAFKEHLASGAKAKGDDALLTRQAFAAYQATKRSGTLDAWKTILSDPAKVEEIKQKDPKSLTQPERDIIQASAAQEQMQNAMTVADVAKQNSAISAGAIAIERHVADKARVGDNPDMGFVNAQVANLNSAFAASGKDITAKYGKRPEVGESEPHGFFSRAGEGLYYVDASGKRIDDSQVLTPPTPASGGGMSARALDFYTRWQSDTSATSKKAAADRLMKEDPKTYNELKNVLTKKP